MMSNGTSGDINNISFCVPRPRQKPMQRMNEVAQLVADRLLAAHKQVTFRKDITAMEQTLLTLKNRQPTAKQIAYAKAVLAGNAPKPVPARPTPMLTAPSPWPMARAKRKSSRRPCASAKWASPVFPAKCSAKSASPSKPRARYHAAISPSSWPTATTATPTPCHLGGYET